MLESYYIDGSSTRTNSNLQTCKFGVEKEGFAHLSRIHMEYPDT